MLYGEFLEGTGCKQNEFNYQVYKRLEIIYMHDDTMSKQDVYEWGKKLVDNSKTEEELAFETKWKSELLSKKEDIKHYKKTIDLYKGYMDQEKDWNTFRSYDNLVKSCRKEIKRLRSEVKQIELILG